MEDKQKNEMQGEGNRAADKRYREGVRETVEKLDLDETGNASGESASDDTAKR